jgi:hypothetical protein
VFIPIAPNTMFGNALRPVTREDDRSPDHDERATQLALQRTISASSEQPASPERGN